MTEVVGFCQEDLDEDDVMLLDTWEEVSTDSPSPQTYFQTGYGLIGLNPSFKVKPRVISLLPHLQTLHDAWADKKAHVQSFTKHVSEVVLLALFQKGGNQDTWSLLCSKLRRAGPAPVFASSCKEVAPRNLPPRFPAPMVTTCFRPSETVSRGFAF